MIKQWIVLVTVSLVTLVVYQNCGKVQFSDDPLLNPLACQSGAAQGINVYPTPCLKKPTYLPSNAKGFQLSGTQFSHFDLASNAAGGTTQETYLYIEIATFSHPDAFIVRYDTATQTDVPLFNVCHLSTWNQSWIASFVTGRPYSSTIMQYGQFGEDPRYWVKLPRGVKKIKFDFSDIVSASYIGVWNLNEFSYNLTAIQTPTAWAAHVQPRLGAPMPGQQNENYSGSPVNDFICPAINGDNIGGYGCFSPGNFRYQAAPLARYNDASGTGDPAQPTCAE